jgi:hypothetical protein
MPARSVSCMTGYAALRHKIEERVKGSGWIYRKRVRSGTGHEGKQSPPFLYRCWLLSTPCWMVPSWLCNVGEEKSSTVTLPILVLDTTVLAPGNPLPIWAPGLLIKPVTDTRCYTECSVRFVIVKPVSYVALTSKYPPVNAGTYQPIFAFIR